MIICVLIGIVAFIIACCLFTMALFGETDQDGNVHRPTNINNTEAKAIIVAGAACKGFWKGVNKRRKY